MKRNKVLDVIGGLACVHVCKSLYFMVQGKDIEKELKMVLAYIALYVFAIGIQSILKNTWK
jgi:hypothetical protein